MKSTFISFKQLIKLVTNDSMLLVIFIAPIIFGFSVKFGVPFLNEEIIMKYTSFNEMYMYYQLIDLFLYVMIPILICFIPAMVVLEEIDDKTSDYMLITPLKSSGYIISRLVYPCIIAFIITIIIASLCSLSKISIFKLTVLIFLSTLTSLTLAMLIVCLAKNKVEGMAICKISSLLILGIPIPYFINSGYQYAASFLPSFWIAKYAISDNPIHISACLLTSFVWIMLLYKKFRKKIIN